jgi:V/A-type H+-transporting ATPase subunit F
MKSFLISDKREALVGMRLAGIDGVLAQTRDEVLDAVSSVMKNEEIGILILTENVADMIADEVLDLKLKAKRPLIVEIPGRHGSKRNADKIAEYIRNSVGIHI